MTNKTTRRALFTSAMAMLICIAMLVGTTFAWFTDSVTSGKNTIVAGNLDVELLYSNDPAAADNQWKSVNGMTDLFDANALWEPGHTEVIYLKVKNLGTLALKYQFSTTFENKVIGESVLGNPIALSEYLEYGIKKDVTVKYADRAAARSAVTGAPLAAHTEVGMLEAGQESAAMAYVVYMPETVGNEANHKTGTAAPVVELGVNLVATQVEFENDSFGNDYDKDATLDFTPVSNGFELKKALADKKENIVLINDVVAEENYVVDYDANINGDGFSIGRSAISTFAAGGTTPYTGGIFTVKTGTTLTLEDVVVDGGAVWTGAENATLKRGTVNAGVQATGDLITTEANAHVVLGEGAVLQNNCGGYAVNLGTRIGATLTLNGGEIINNYSAGAAVWGGGAITVNSGKISYNHGGLGGAIRVVTNIGTILTMNGGEINHNYSESNGGATWAGGTRSNNVYVLAGGEMAYNYSAVAGGAMYAGYCETVKISDTFKMHDNDCAESIGAAIRFHNHASLVMTGGEIYNNGDNDNSIYLNNNSASITGGKIVDNFGYYGGLGLTWGMAEVDGVITYNLSTNHNTAYLAKDFATLKFKTNASASNFANFNFKPAADYTYTEGDEAKLICMNDGYETYWDVATSTFRLKAK